MSGERNQLGRASPATPHDNRKGGFNKRDPLVISDRSGLTYDRSNTKKEWTGLIVGKDEWEPRHPQEFRRGIREDIAVKEARPGSPLTATLAVGLADLTAVSGAVAGGAYTSGAASEVRPFVYWTLDLGEALSLSRIDLASLGVTNAASPIIRQGFAIGYSSDNVTYTDVAPTLGAFSDGVGPAPTDYAVPLNITARYLRLALIDGRGLGFTGVLSHGAVTVVRNI